MKLTLLLCLATSVTAMAATEEQFAKHFDAKPDGKLIVDVDFGTVTVTNCEGNQVSVDVWRKITRKSKEKEQDFLKENPVVITQEGDTVTIRSINSNKPHFLWTFSNRQEAKYTIGVPDHFNTRINTAGGGISVRGLTGQTSVQTSGGGLRFDRLKGPINGNTSGGGIHIMDCEGGPIRIQTSGGGIDVANSGGTLDGNTSGGSVAVKNFKGPANVSSSGGGITVENVTGKIAASTSGGSVYATLVSPITDSVQLETSGGGITIRAPQNAAFNIDAETSGGGVNCEFPVVVQGKLESNSLHGPVNGGGKTVTAHTSGGSIHIKKL